ncbi:unnamed protein product [Acidithrix sp. C25]|nr:unnamed protein product [Acidithrix sp. C25]
MREISTVVPKRQFSQSTGASNGNIMAVGRSDPESFQN